MADCVCCDCESKCRGSISLSEWFDILCINNYYAHQLGQWRNDYPTTRIPIEDTNCTQFVFERCHQDCTLAGRDQVCDAILQADQTFLDYMKYPPAPTALCTEFFFGKGDRCLNVSGQRPYAGGVLQLDHFKIQALGKETLTFVETVTFDATAQLSDNNGDSLFDRATLTIAKPTNTTADEIALFFVESDRGNTACCRHEIRPLTVKDNGATFTITIPSWVMVKPSMYESYADGTVDSVLDPQMTTIYPTQIDVYRRWVDTTKAVTVWRKPVNCGCGLTADTPCYECEETTACIISSEQGLIEVKLPTIGDCGCCAQCAQRLCVHYISGGCDYERLIARYAASLLQANVCCSPTQIAYYAQDFVGVNDRGRIVTPLSDAERSTVWGTKRAGIEAYRALRNKRKMRIAAL